MKLRSVAKGLGLTIATGVAIPALFLLSVIVRMEVVGDKPAASGAELARIEQLQWAIQLGSFLVGVVAFAWLAFVVLKRT